MCVCHVRLYRSDSRGRLLSSLHAPCCSHHVPSAFGVQVVLLSAEQSELDEEEQPPATPTQPASSATSSSSATEAVAPLLAAVPVAAAVEEVTATLVEPEVDAEADAEVVEDLVEHGGGTPAKAVEVLDDPLSPVHIE